MVFLYLLNRDSIIIIYTFLGGIFIHVCLIMNNMVGNGQIIYIKK